MDIIVSDISEDKYPVVENSESLDETLCETLSETLCETLSEESSENNSNRYFVNTLCNILHSCKSVSFMEDISSYKNDAIQISCDLYDAINKKIVNHKPILLTPSNTKEYNDYKYSCIEQSFLANLYRKYFTFVQRFVNPSVHPNILTFLGLLSVLISYTFRGWSSTTMAIGVFLYLTFDGIDGIHARATGQTSVIGEYADHVFDLINAGLISIAFCENIGITSNMIQNMYITTCSFLFMLPHIKSIDNGIIVFEGLTDVSMVLSTVIITFLINIKLYDSVANSYIVYSAIFSSYCYFLYDLYKTQLENSESNKIKTHVLFYYIVKWTTLFIFPTNNSWHISISDIYLLMQLTNYKIFKLEYDVTSCLVPIFYIVAPNLTIIGVLYYFVKSMHQISEELKINVIYSPNIVVSQSNDSVLPEDVSLTKKNI